MCVSKTYKLIKEYPGSPELGYIFNPDTIGDEKIKII